VPRWHPFTGIEILGGRVSFTAHVVTLVVPRSHVGPGGFSTNRLEGRKPLLFLQGKRFGPPLTRSNELAVWADRLALCYLSGLCGM
jgi:hypothetical protein